MFLGFKGASFLQYILGSKKKAFYNVLRILNIKRNLEQ